MKPASSSSSLSRGQAKSGRSRHIGSRHALSGRWLVVSLGLALLQAGCSGGELPAADGAAADRPEPGLAPPRTPVSQDQVSAEPSPADPTNPAGRVYTVTPISPGEGLIRSATVVMAEGGQLIGQASVPRFQGAAVFHWSPAAGYSEIGRGAIQLNDINDHGIVAGALALSPTTLAPFLWSRASPGPIRLSAPAEGARPVAISNAGLVVGVESGSGYEETFPVYWAVDGSRHRIETGQGGARILAMNREGLAAGAAGGGFFLWSLAAGAQWVADGPEADTFLPQVVGEGGQVVGRARDRAAGLTRPFVWSAADGLRLIPADVAGGSPEHRYGVSRDGAVISSAQIDRRPLYWTPAAGLQDLLGEAGSSGQALAISPGGTVAGWFTDGSEIQHAFVWRPAEGLINLNERIDPALGIHLDSAIRVTDDGRILALADDGLVLLSDPAQPQPQPQPQPRPQPQPQPPRQPPVLAATEADESIRAGQAFAVGATFTNAGAGDQHQAVWGWGDDSDFYDNQRTGGEGGREGLALNRAIRIRR